MKLAVLYNESAGDGLSVAGLRRALEQHGHELAHLIEKDSEFERAFDGSTEAVVAAGGDGTVWRAANALVGRQIPLAILPVGTANNIATSLGLEEDVSRVVQSWATARPVPFDIGILQSGENESRFIEGLGIGLVPAAITTMDQAEAESDEEKDDADVRLKRALHTYQELLARSKPHACTLVIDGERTEGAFVLVEILNIRSVGPNLVFAPDADPSDGFFDVVTAGEEDRAKIARYLEDRLEGRQTELRLPTRRAREIEIEHMTDMHLDDTVRQWSSDDEASIRVQAAALRVLIPAPPQTR